MSIDVVMPPRENDLELVEKAKEILFAATDLGMNINVEGFIMAWASGTKVVVEYDDDEKIVSVGIITIGKRWTNNDVSAHVLTMAGNKDKLIDYFIKMCQISDATSLFYQEDGLLEDTPEYNRYAVKEIKVR